jgi:hypothetical protein
MSIGEGIAASIRYKFYTSGDMVSNTEADMTTQPGQTGGQILRRVSSTLGLGKDTYRSNEKRTDRQVADMRHGGRRSQGAISGELSPRTFFDFIQATHRDFGGGDPVAAGLGVGDIFRITGATAAAVNGVNFLVIGFSTASNRKMDTFPAMPDFAADTGSWTITRPGRVSAPPSTGFVKRKVALEVANEDMGASRFFPECRVTGYRMGLPVNGMNTFEPSILGRGMKVLDGASSPVAYPYFTAPAAPTVTGITGPMDGVLMIGSTQVGTVTGLNLTATLVSEAAMVRAQKFGAEIFLGEFGLTGDISAYLETMDLVKAFTDETELSLLTTVYSDTSAAAEGIAIHLPRIKLTSGDTPLQGDGGQTFSGSFQALKYLGTSPGVAQTTVRIHDTAAL